MQQRHPQVQVAHVGENRNAYRVLVETLEAKKPPGRSRQRWEDNIKMYIKEIG
jgi:hypothetical protein